LFSLLLEVYCIFKAFEQNIGVFRYLVWWTWRQAGIKVEGRVAVGEAARVPHRCLSFRRIIGYGQTRASSSSGRPSSTPSCSPSSPIAWSSLSRSTCRSRTRPYSHRSSRPRRSTSSGSSASRRASRLSLSASSSTAAPTCATSGTSWTSSSW